MKNIFYRSISEYAAHATDYYGKWCLSLFKYNFSLKFFFSFGKCFNWLNHEHYLGEIDEYQTIFEFFVDVIWNFASDFFLLQLSFDLKFHNICISNYFRWRCFFYLCLCNVSTFSSDFFLFFVRFQRLFYVKQRIFSLWFFFRKLEPIRSNVNFFCF